jgi:threonyl-tRNA synthetase
MRFDMGVDYDLVVGYGFWIDDEDHIKEIIDQFEEQDPDYEFRDECMISDDYENKWIFIGEVITSGSHYENFHFSGEIDEKNSERLKTIIKTIVKEYPKIYDILYNYEKKLHFFNHIY